MKLENSLPGIKKNILLKKYTTFKIGGPAKYFYLAKTKEDLIRALIAAREFKLPFFILGNGSNLLVADSGFPGLVIKIQNRKFKIRDSKVFAQAGIKLKDLQEGLVMSGLTGMEWTAGIPGTLGGAVRGNAGAFGSSMDKVVKAVEVFNIKNFKTKKFNKKDCHFAYRDSVFKKNKNLIILSAQLYLKRGKKSQIKKRIRECLEYRKKNHPQEPSAGSVFKNPEIKKLGIKFFKKFPEAKKAVKENVLPAAFLIAKCNLIGKRIGGAQVSSKHPNFIVNTSCAKAKDVKELINSVKKIVKKRFWVNLEEEIEHLGF